MKEETTIQCKNSPTEKHEYVTLTLTGNEECKHCHLLRSTAEKKPILSPFLQKLRVNKAVEPTPETVDELIKKAQDKNVPDWLFQSILRETKSKGCVVITFDSEVLTNPISVKEFHISAVNITLGNIRGALQWVVDALSGRLGGTMNMRSEDKP